MRSPEQQWWIEDERKRMARQHWQPLMGAIAVLTIAAVAIWALVTM